MRGDGWGSREVDLASWLGREPEKKKEERGGMVSDKDGAANSDGER